MGLAAVVTAWCAFESAKWSGIQSIRFAQAGASRTESTRNDMLDHQLGQIDVASFVAWIQALGQEKGNLERLTPPYRPDPMTASGILFLRFRPPFRDAVNAWLATRPLRNEGAPPTPFVMAAYRRPLHDKAEALLTDADEKVQAGLQANRNADNYMLVTVFSSMVIFFAGLSTKLELPANGFLLLMLSFAVFILCVIAIFRLPVVVF
jgi:hypothetical protein